MTDLINFRNHLTSLSPFSPDLAQRTRGPLESSGPEQGSVLMKIWPVPSTQRRWAIGTQKFFSSRYPVLIGTQKISGWYWTSLVGLTNLVVSFVLLGHVFSKNEKFTFNKKNHKFSFRTSKFEDFF